MDTDIVITEIILRKEKEALYLYKAIKSIFRASSFEDAARDIFDYCLGTIGADAGYIALLSEDNIYNEVLFLEAGHSICTVDENIPMPVRGLREIAYNTAKTVYHNDFMNSEWIKFLPPGHVLLNNVMFAPLVISGKVTGVMGIANKETPFNDNDKELATRFGEIAAIALQKFKRKQYGT